MLEAALSYVAKGWPLFPCAPGSKAPHQVLGRSGGFHHATLCAETVRGWWRAAPDALIGSAASFAVDIDTPEGIASARRLGLSAGAIVRTANGWHAHFAPIPRAKPRGLVDGLTIRPVNRAYVILPPSRHPSGAIYAWVNVPEAPLLQGLPRLPEAALDAIAPALTPLRRLPRARSVRSGVISGGLRRHAEQVLARVRDAPEGARHPTALAAAVHLARIESEHGLDPGVFREPLEEAALAAGLQREEVAGVGYRTGIAEWAWERCV